MSEGSWVRRHLEGSRRWWMERWKGPRPRYLYHFTYEAVARKILRDRMLKRHRAPGVAFGIPHGISFTSHPSVFVPKMFVWSVLPRVPKACFVVEASSIPQAYPMVYTNHPLVWLRESTRDRGFWSFKFQAPRILPWPSNLEREWAVDAPTVPLEDGRFRLVQGLQVWPGGGNQAWHDFAQEAP
ncbi:MAG: hypothetical protein KGI89_02950 [Euryarchaeota archaeon]|nr:hypothetical protein [Euryarchaeota archaeon]